MNSQTTIFFDQMSERIYGENNLSDITWALMNTIPKFQNLFIEYCFNKKIQVFETEREYADTDSRPDFFFYDVTGKKYLIEVKIGDRNMHFVQYNKNKFFSDCEKSFIANYQWQKEDGWHVKTWEGFYKLLKKQIVAFSNEENSLVEGYLQYLKKVIYYEEVTSVNISNLESIRCFYVMINNVILSYSKIKMEEYNNSKSCTPDKYGRFACFTIDKKSVYFWLGLYFTEETGVYFEFKYNDEFWVPKKYALLLEKLDSGKYHDKPIMDSNTLWIKLNNIHFKKLCDKEIDVEKQKNVIENFLKEIMEKVFLG